ncbi:MAG: response regulator [Myxococcales bacterium]|nr:response regulator [Myxococcales bacterium]
MAEAPTIVVVGSEGAAPPVWLEGLGNLREVASTRATEGEVLAGTLDLSRLVLAVLDGAALRPREIREAILKAAPLAVVVSTAGSPAEPTVPTVDEASLRLLLAVARSAGVRSAAADVALAALGAGYVVLEGDRSLAWGGTSGIGLARSGAPVDALDDDVFEEPAAPPRRFRVAGEGGERVIERKLAPLGDKHDNSVIVHADVTSRAGLEARLLAGGRAEATSQLARGVVHDLNNAFCVIASFTDLLQESFEGDDPRLEDVREISRAGAKATALTGKLVGFSRGGPARTENVNLADAARRAEPLFRRVLGEGAELALALTSTEATAHCDPLELEAVLTGLAGQAGRRLDGVDGVVTVGVSEDPPWVVVQVSATATADGADLTPLPTSSAETDAAAAFAAKYGGRFEGGTIRMPKAPKRAPAQRIPRAKITDRGPETVLVLEDEASVRLAVKRVLSSLGYEVLEARRGEDARALVDSCDLVIADLVLPGEGGLEALRAFHARRPALPALVLTGYAGETASSVGGYPLIHKPFDAAELARRVRQALDGG